MVVILHNTRSLYNIGSIFRTADAAGIEKIYLCGITARPVDVFGKPRQQLIKVSLGAEKTVPWEWVKSTTLLIDKLKSQGYKIFSIEQSKRSLPYYKIKIKNYKKTALVLGGEVKGLPESILKRSDKILEIPMQDAVVRQVVRQAHYSEQRRRAHHPRRLGRGKESLNVGVAFGIVVFNLKHPG